MRMIQHFPMMEGQKASLIVADLSADCVEAKVSESALQSICKEVRREATTDRPYLPPTGELLKKAVDRTRLFENPNGAKPQQRIQPVARAVEIERSCVPWAFKNYDQIQNEGLLAQIRVHFTSFVNPMRADVYRRYLITHCGFPYGWMPA